MSTTLMEFSTSLKALLNEVQATDRHYVRCFKPNDFTQKNSFVDGVIQRQLRCSGLFEGCQVLRDGYSFRMDKRTLVQLHGDFLDHVSSKDYAIGRSKIFLRAAALCAIRRRERATVTIQHGLARFRERKRLAQQRAREAEAVREDRADEDHADEDHADEDHADEGHADEGHADEGHTDEDHANEGHADEGHADEDHAATNENHAAAPGDNRATA